MRAPAALPLLIVLACRSIPPPEDLVSRDLGAISPATGTVSVDVLKDDATPEIRLGRNEEFVPAYLHPNNPQPGYPPDLIAAQVPAHRIAVRVLFDEQGTPIRITDSPVAASTDSPHTARFRAAVEEAIRMWRCGPAAIRKFRDGPDSDGDGKADFRIMSDQLRIRTYFDVAFVFEIVNGQPVVR